MERREGGRKSRREQGRKVMIVEVREREEKMELRKGKRKEGWNKRRMGA